MRQISSRTNCSNVVGLIARLHDLRHTCAVLHMKAGVPVKVVQELPGHATIGMQEDAAEPIAALLAPTP